ncbi:hypothetical protein ACMD2_15839 [Ananas comosus]|uniref:Uncharacterized protein n=1 Tax=Ananas comosus TaxID=4615 RepID=A0A199UR54_ANACO|nr:hypothetical protein ACMD2_15839 [Ananas comosus]
MLLLQRLVVAVDAVEGLREGEEQEEDGGDEGDDGPGVAEVVVLQGGGPGAPLVVVVAVDLLGEAREVAVVDVEHHLLAEAVEEVGDLALVAQPVLDDAAVVEVAHVVLGVDEVVHEDHVGGDVVGGVHVALLEGDQVEEEGLGAVVDQDARDAEHAVLEGDVPEPVRLAPAAPDAGLAELRHAVDQLLPAPVGDAARARRGRLRPRAEEALPEHVQARVEFGGGGHPGAGVEEADGERGDVAGLVGAAGLDAEQAVEDEERDLVLQHDHVALHGVHGPAHREHGVAPRVAERGEPALLARGGAAEELEGEGPVEHQRQHELVGGEAAGAALVAGADAVLEGADGVEVGADVVAGAPEDAVEGAPLVRLHVAEAAAAVVEGAEGDDLGDVGPLVALAERLGDAVDGQLRPGAGRVHLPRLLQLLPDRDHPFRVGARSWGSGDPGRRGSLFAALLPLREQEGLGASAEIRGRGGGSAGFGQIGLDGLLELEGDEVPAQELLVEHGHHLALSSAAAALRGRLDGVRTVRLNHVMVFRFMPGTGRVDDRLILAATSTDGGSSCFDDGRVHKLNNRIVGLGPSSSSLFEIPRCRESSTRPLKTLSPHLPDPAGIRIRAMFLGAVAEHDPRPGLGWRMPC